MLNIILRTKIQIAFFLAKKSGFPLTNDPKRRIFFFLAADYGNLGDVAITYAQKKFLADRFPDSEVVEIPISSTLSGIKSIKRLIRDDDVVVIVGGGNMGDIYDDIEFLRQLVIKSFKKNKIISFPQTVEFSQTFSGRIALKVASRLYNSHRYLTLLAREQVSFHLMRQYFPKNEIRLLPDIVMTLDERQPDVSRRGVLLCLRNDSEKKYDVADAIKEHLKGNGIPFKCFDTHIGNRTLTEKERKRELKSFWFAFAHSEYVITDRLHGMIFAFITGTPALVIPNSNHKIQSSYEWIKDCGYIRLVCHIDEMENEMDCLCLHTENHFAEVRRRILSAYKAL